MASAERPADAVRVSAARCPFCHEEVQRGVEPAVCVACHALHHVECMAEHGACSACGASHPRFSPVVRPARAVAARPVARPGSLTLPRLLGRLSGYLANRRAIPLVLLVLAALYVTVDGRDKLHILLAWVVLGGACVGALGAALVDVRRGVGAALVAVAPGIALVFGLGDVVGPAQTYAGLGLALAVGTLGARLLYWPRS